MKRFLIFVLLLAAASFVTLTSVLSRSVRELNGILAEELGRAGEPDRRFMDTLQRRTGALAFGLVLEADNTPFGAGSVRNPELQEFILNHKGFNRIVAEFRIDPDSFLRRKQAPRAIKAIVAGSGIA